MGPTSWISLSTASLCPTYYPANTYHWSKAGLMLAHCLRRWANINPTLGRSKCPVFAGYPPFHILALHLQYALLCYRATGAMAPHCGFSGVSPSGNCACVHWVSFTSNSKSVRRDIWFTWFSEPHDTTSLHNVLVYTAPGSPRRSPIQLWTGRGVAYLQWSSRHRWANAVFCIY